MVRRFCYYGIVFTLQSLTILSMLMMHVKSYAQ
jgi:hypothetical protein